MEITPEYIADKVEVVSKGFKNQGRVIYATFVLTIIGCAFGIAVFVRVYPVIENINKIPTLIAKQNKMDSIQNVIQYFINYDSLDTHFKLITVKVKRQVASK
jgi:hypothetical protein